MQELLAALPDWLGVYLLIVNVATIAVYGADKRRAKQRRWRVPENTTACEKASVSVWQWHILPHLL